MQAPDAGRGKRQRRDATGSANSHYRHPRTAQPVLGLPGTGSRRQVQPSEIAAGPVVSLFVTLGQPYWVWGCSVFHIARLDELSQPSPHRLGGHSRMQPDHPVNHRGRSAGAVQALQQYPDPSRRIFDLGGDAVRHATNPDPVTSDAVGRMLRLQPWLPR